MSTTGYTSRVGEPVKLIIQIPCFNEEETLPDRRRPAPGGRRHRPWSSGWSSTTAAPIAPSRWLAPRRRSHRVARRQPGAGARVRDRARGGCGSAPTSSSTPTPTTSTRARRSPRWSTPILAGEADMVVGERPIDVDRRLLRDQEGPATARQLGRARSPAPGCATPRAASGPSRARRCDASPGLRRLHLHDGDHRAGRMEHRDRRRCRSGPTPRPAESRLVKSSARYVWRSAQAIIRSFALYKPFRFFFLVGLVPFLLGTLLLLRWLGLYLFEDEYTSRVPSLLAGIGLIVVAAQTWAVAFLADLQAANRRVVEDLRLRAARSTTPSAAARLMRPVSPPRWWERCSSAPPPRRATTPGRRDAGDPLHRRPSRAQYIDRTAHHRRHRSRRPTRDRTRPCRSHRPTRPMATMHRRRDSTPSVRAASTPPGSRPDCRRATHSWSTRQPTRPTGHRPVSTTNWCCAGSPIGPNSTTPSSPRSIRLRVPPSNESSVLASSSSSAAPHGRPSHLPPNSRRGRSSSPNRSTRCAPTTPRPSS